MFVTLTSQHSQTVQSLDNFVDHNWGCTSTYCSLSYPLRSLKNDLFVDLYKNMSQARENPRGLVAVSIFVRLAESIYRNSNFEDFSKYLDRVSQSSKFLLSEASDLNNH